MGLFSRDKPSRRTMTASAARQPLDRSQGPQTVRKALPWQIAAYGYFNSPVTGIPEVGDGVEILANGCARVRFYPAVLGDDDKPRPLTEKEDGPLAELAATALAYIGKGPAQSAFIKPYALNLSLAGELYLEGWRDPATQTESVRVRSVLEVEDVNGKVGFRPNDGAQPVKAGDDTLWLQRIWQPDPAYINSPTSRLKALEPTCQELLKLSQAERAGDNSRLARSGALFVDNRVDLPPDGPDDDRSMPQRLADMIFDAASASITVDGSASSAIPIVVGVNVEANQKIADLVHHQTFDRPQDDSTITRRDKLIDRLGRGLPIPPDSGKGMANVKYSNAQVSKQQLASLYVEPTSEILADGLTTALVQPFLTAAATGENAAITKEQAASVFVWYDSTELTSNPDQSADAEAAHAAGAIGDAAYRKARGFSDSDAPTPGERVFGLVKQTTDPALLAQAILALGSGWDPSREGLTALPHPMPATSAAPAAPKPLLEATPAPVAEASPNGTLPPRSLTAAGRPARAVRYAARPVVDLDARTRERIHAEMDGAIRRAVEKAGARVKGAAQKDPTTKAMAAAVEPAQVCRLLQPAVTAALMGMDTVGVNVGHAVASRLAQDTRDALRERIGKVLRSAQDATIAATAAHVPATARAATAAKQTADATRYTAQALDYLDSAVGAALTDQLFSPEPAVSPIPPNVARAVVAIAAGLPPGHAGYDTSGRSMQPGGGDAVNLATGQLATDGWTAGGLQRDAYEWQYGISENHFEPHYALNGFRFSSFTDPRLKNPGAFPADAYLGEGDHQGCACTIVPLFFEDSGFDGDGDTPSTGPDRPLYLDTPREGAA